MSNTAPPPAEEPVKVEEIPPPAEELVKVEEIPHEARLVRFLADGEFDVYQDQVVASQNALKDPELSVDDAGSVRLAASCTSFDSALAAARLLRGRLAYPAFERRLAHADDAW